jgi:adenine deaminase
MREAAGYRWPTGPVCSGSMGNRDLASRVAVARGDAQADAVLAGGRVLSVFTGELLEADVVLAGEHVAALGAPGTYRGAETHDVSGLILVPGFIDGHMHVESTKLTPAEFARAALPHGTTTVVLDPHEVGNVLGARGILQLLALAEGIPIDIYAMASSCVPASSLETSGHTLDHRDIAALLNHPRIIGLAEMMNYPAVVSGDPEALAKIEAAGSRHVDGHAPGLSGPGLNAYLAAGVQSDHECSSLEEALEKRRLGMWIMIREGSAARNLEALIPLILQLGPENCMLVTDDREPHDLLREGHLDNALRKAVALGCMPEHAVVMATLHPARYHRLHGHGAVAPGYLADVVALPDLEEFRPARVWKRGRLVFDGDRVVDFPTAEVPDWMLHTMHAAPVTEARLRIPASEDGGLVRVMEVRAGQIVTGALTAEPRVEDGAIVADPSRDLAKIAVAERHRESGRIGIGLVRGFGLEEGALGSTVAHDAHNVMLVGTNDRDMAVAAARLTELAGGQVVVRDGRVLAEVALPLGGLVSLEPREEVARQAIALEEAARDCGVTLRSPFMALSFLALSVIPELKVTDLGLVDGVKFELVPLQV